MPRVLSDTRDRPLSVKGLLVIVVCNLSKNMHVNISYRSRFRNDMHLPLGEGKKKKKRVRENLLLGYSRSCFSPFFPPPATSLSFSLKDLPSYEFESLKTCLHKEIYRPNYTSIIRLINLPVYTSLNFKSSIVSECKPSEKLYFRPLNCACQLWADCLSLRPSFLISKQWGSLDTKSLY